MDAGRARFDLAPRVAGRGRALHDAVEDFTVDADWTWSERAADPSGSTELLCHNDLGIWNLVRSGGDWISIDWDLAAPRRRSWDLSLALTTAVSLMPSAGVDEARTLRRIRAFVRGYGAEAFPPDTLTVALERCGFGARIIEADAARGDTVAQRLLAEGHADTWRAAEQHLALNRTVWETALL